jgi:hypothetical protein
MGRTCPQIAGFVLLLALAAASGEATAKAIKLANGDVIDAEIVEETDEKIVVQHPSLGRLELRNEQLAARGKAGMFGTRFLEGWDRNLALGLSGTSGNSSTLSGVGKLHLGMQDEHRRWNVDGAYFLTKTNHDTDTSNGYLQAVRDFLDPARKWFPYAETRYEYDQFRDPDHRASAGAGIGYPLLDTERFSLLGRLGAGVSYQWGGSDSDLAPELLAGLEGKYLVSERQRITFYTKFYPDLSDPSEFRNLSGAAWQIDFDRSDGLSLLLGVENRYESAVSSDSERNDLKYYSTLVIDF